MKRTIIGGGMSGLVCAILSAKKGIATTVLESNSRVGKKISVTGNGKCNLLNLNSNASFFNKSAVAKNVLNSVSVDDCVDFFRSVGIFTFADTLGRVYPITENANSVVDCLRFACDNLGVETRTNCTVKSVKKDKNARFVLQTTDGQSIVSDEVVLACGSRSQFERPSLECIVPKEFFTPVFPSLVPVKIFDMDKQLNGLRLKTNVLLKADGEILAKSHGEVQFKEYGLSGICIMDLSAQIARQKVLGINKSYTFVLDLVPSLSQQQLEEELKQRTPKNLFLGLLHNKLAQSVSNRAKSTDTATLATLMKHFELKFEKLLDFSLSQVSAGGIDEKFVNENLQLPNGMFALGEILNVDGICGGHNLYFAVASAIFFNK